MDLLGKFGRLLGSAKDELSTQVGRFKNKSFMQGAISVCAYIAFASDGVNAEERQKIADFVRNSDLLKVFRPEEIVEFLNKRLASFEFDMEIGKGEALSYILALKNDPAAAQLALRVGVSVAKSDGDFDEKEKAAVRELCRALALDESGFV